MSDRDNITLPRELVLHLKWVLEEVLLHGDCTERSAIEALRTHLAAPKQEPVAWQYKGEPSFDGNRWHDNYQVTTSKQVAKFKDKNAQPLYTAPPDIEALRRDAERYRWLRQERYMFREGAVVSCDAQSEIAALWVKCPVTNDATEVDAAIDAAMQEDKT